MKILYPFIFLLLSFVCCNAQNMGTDIPINTTGNFVQSENSVFISPLSNSIIVNANNSEDWPCSPGFTIYGADVFSSITGGNAWPNAHPSGPSSQKNGGDPAVVINRNGRMYVNFITCTPCSPNPNALARGQGITWSDDNGITWQPIVDIAIQNPIAGNPFFDKNHLWVDNRIYKKDGSANPALNYLYSAWTSFQSTSNPKHIEITRSTDGGSTWSSRVNISSATHLPPNGFDHGVNIQTGPNGEVYACWAIYNDFTSTDHWERAIGFARLDDPLQWPNWSPSDNAVNNILGIRTSVLQHELGGGKLMRTNSFPSMTVNQQNGNIFIVWANQGVPCASTNPPGCNDQNGNIDIYMVRMINGQGGCCWSEPILVNSIQTNDQWFPWITCDEASGALVCVYYDSRTNNSLADTYVSISYDQGDTWTDYPISDASWNADGIPCSGPIDYAGDYISVDAYHGLAIPVWSDRRSDPMISYANPFLIPCPSDLSLCNADIVDEVAYKTTNSIYIGGGTECFYTIHSVGSAIMQATNEITFDSGFESNGELYAYTDPNCTSFSQRTENITAPPIPAPSSTPFVFSHNTVAHSQINNSVPITPNPSTGSFTISLKESTQGEVFIYNTLGQLIYKSTIQQLNNSTIDLSSHPRGIYFLKVQSADGKIYTEKIILSAE